jgi:hypothetical protein
VDASGGVFGAALLVVVERFGVVIAVLLGPGGFRMALVWPANPIPAVAAGSLMPMNFMSSTKFALSPRLRHKRLVSSTSSKSKGRGMRLIAAWSLIQPGRSEPAPDSSSSV